MRNNLIVSILIFLLLIASGCDDSEKNKPVTAGMEKMQGTWRFTRAESLTVNPALQNFIKENPGFAKELARMENEYIITLRPGILLIQERSGQTKEFDVKLESDDGTTLVLEVRPKQNSQGTMEEYIFTIDGAKPNMLMVDMPHTGPLFFQRMQ